MAYKSKWYRGDSSSYGFDGPDRAAWKAGWIDGYLGIKTNRPRRGLKRKSYDRAWPIGRLKKAGMSLFAPVVAPDYTMAA